ncbi:MAG: DNA helicase-2/ATP-dependent DNA helicase PcrA [Flammeovirgaceae bacterium]|jgi:DNA helicase-2/ATP-dependent DNA helicase PcrA
MDESLIRTLNPPQQEAVMHTNGPLMIIAGAGSGKTRVLTYRIANLISKGVEPFNILSLTFTNKAAKEMRERIEKLVGKEARNLWMGTFHSIFAKILRFEADILGYTSNFTIYDSDDSKSLLKQIIKDFQLNDKLYKVNGVLGRISSSKNNLVSWRAYQNNSILLAEDETAGRPKMAQIYQEYCTRCFRANAMDFDDLLFNTNVLFHKSPEALNKYQHKFKYVMIDEFQDTNLSQYGITKMLAAVHQNICVVGDDAQSIYAFRGANIQNILNFEKDFDDLKTVKLEQNYRSTQNIVEAANSLIKHNRNQLRKSVWTENSAGEFLELTKCTSDIEEGRLVADSIFETKMQHNLENKDFAILYRTNAQSRSIEESLRKMNIGYKIIGGLSFYQRKEIKDIVAYLRFTVNSSDEEAFKRIINLPRRGIGKTSVDKIRVAAMENDVSIWEVVSHPAKYLGKGRLVTSIANFAMLIKSFKISIEANNAFEAASHVAKNSGILKELYDDKTIEGRVRYDNVQELLNAIKAFVDDPEQEDKSMEMFLQEVSLVSSADKEMDDDAVTLMTIHMSKGLEFEHVYVMGMEENLFPSQMMLGSREDLEEERRLFYVAITRAKQKLHLSYALQRYKFGSLISCESSRFLEEIDPQYIHQVKKKSFGGFSDDLFSNSPSDSDSDFSTGFSKGIKGIGQKKDFGGFTRNVKKPTSVANNFRKIPVGKKHTSSSNFQASNPNEIVEGIKVEHQKFGFGKVLKLDDAGASKKATVNFENFGEKTLILTFAKLMIHEEN